MTAPCLAAAVHPGHVCARRDGRPIFDGDDGDCHHGAVLDLWLSQAVDRQLATLTVRLPDVVDAARTAIEAVGAYLAVTDAIEAGGYSCLADEVADERRAVDDAVLNLALAASLPWAAQKAQARP